MAARWLDPAEARAWRSLMEMQDGLSEFIERQLRNRCGLSHADYQVLAHLSEAPEGRLRSFELGELLHWEKSRLSQHLGGCRIAASCLGRGAAPTSAERSSPSPGEAATSSKLRPRSTRATSGMSLSTTSPRPSWKCS